MAAPDIDSLISLYNQGAFRALERRAAKALKAAPTSLALHNLYAAALLQSGSPKKSLTHLQHALKTLGEHASFYSNMGAAHRALGDTVKAIEAYAKALAISPDDIVAHNNLGNAYADSGRHDLAAAHFRKALSINPDFTMARNSLAGAHFSLREFDKAVAVIRESIARDPAPIDSHVLKSHMLEKLNRLDEAEQTIAAPLAALPDDPGLLIAAARIDLRRKRCDEAHRKLTRVLAEPGGLSTLDQAEAYYLDSECLDSLARYDAAFDAAARANALRVQTTDALCWDKDRYLKKIERLARAFDGADPAQWRSDGEHVPPVFLVGFPRSGTTLLNQILSAHPDVVSLDEQPASAMLLRELEKDGALFPGLSPTLRQQLQNAYWAAAKSCGAERGGGLVIDKMPLNIVHAAQLKLVFPDARFLFALRDPRDALLSGFMQHFELNDAMANFFRLEDGVRLYSAVMSLWRRYEDVLQPETLYVRYEKIVSNLAGEAPRIASFLGLRRDDALLTYRDRAPAQPVATPSYRQVTEPLYQTAANRWRNYEERIGARYRPLSPWIAHFGYDRA